LLLCQAVLGIAASGVVSEGLVHDVGEASFEDAEGFRSADPGGYTSGEQDRA
jgi:hypothetical protein